MCKIIWHCDKAQRIFEKKSKDNIEGILISTKIGYHSSYKEKEFVGFKSGLIFDLSADNTISKTASIGVNVEIWKSSDEKFPDIYGYLTTRDYLAWGLSFLLKYRKLFNAWNLSFGFGAGSYSIAVTSGKYTDTDNYLNLNFISDISFVLSKYILLSSELSFKNLLNFDTRKYFFSIKLGPTLIIN